MTITYDPNDSFELLPEGRYKFKVREEVESRKGTSGSTGKKYVYHIFKFTVTNEFGESRKYNDILVPWKPPFKDLLIVLGATPGEDGKLHLSETECVGKVFEGFIEHQENPNKPGENKDKLASVVVPEEEPEEEDVPMPSGNGEEGDDSEIPF